MNDGFIGDLIVCIIVVLMAVYWVYGVFNGRSGGGGSWTEYYESGAR